MPRVCIGLPTYNRPEMLDVALANLLGQTFADFELVVSDNASPDSKVEEICCAYAAKDARVRYIRRPVNLGPAENFFGTLDEAAAPLFMWAANDDVWPPTFVERAVEALDRDRRAVAWFCHLENIAWEGGLWRAYPSFARFSYGASPARDILNYFFEPEVMGKANLIYAVVRTDVLRSVVKVFRRSDCWGLDMALVYGILCRGRLLIDDRITMQKRVVKGAAPWAEADPRIYIYPWVEARKYFSEYLRGAKGTGFWLLTACAIPVRWTSDVIYHRRAGREAPLFPPKASKAPSA